MHRDGLEAGGVVGRAGGAVEVVPDRDPVEAERLDPLPQQPQLVGGRVLQAGVHPEPCHRATPLDGSSERSSVRETAAMPRATVATTNPGAVEIEYETFGSPDDPALLLVMGFTAQLIAWDVEFCELLAEPRPLRHPLRQPRLRAVDAPRRPARRSRRRSWRPSLSGERAAAGAVHAVGHGRRRRRPARPPRHRAGPRGRRVDGRDDRPDDRHRAPRALPQPDLGDELAGRPAGRQADAGGAGRC